MTLEQIHEEVEKLRNRECLWKAIALFTSILFIRTLFEAHHENKRALVYREIAVDAMHLIGDPDDIDPIMLAIAQTDDAD